MDIMGRIPTHIEGLDDNMQGGIPKGHICIVAGASGAMKSSVTFSMPTTPYCTEKPVEFTSLLNKAKNHLEPTCPTWE